MIRFIQITDIHLPQHKEDLLHNIPIYELFVEIINDIIKNEELYDFVVLSGDLSDKGFKESYELLDSVLSVLSIPCYWIPGNHDDLKVLQNISPYWKLCNNKSFNIKNIHFTLLNSVTQDTEGKNKARGKLEKKELEFLEEDLYKNSLSPSIIIIHHPPIYSGTWKDEKMLKNYDEFFEIVDRYQNVKLILYGHQHQTLIKIRNNVIYYSPPSASFQFDREVKWAFENSSPGYGIIEINDSFEINCNGKRVNFPVNPIYEK